MGIAMVSVALNSWFTSHFCLFLHLSVCLLSVCVSVYIPFCLSTSCLLVYMYTYILENILKAKEEKSNGKWKILYNNMGQFNVVSKKKTKLDSIY